MVKNIVRRDFLKTAAGAMAMGAVPPLVFADGLSRKGVNILASVSAFVVSTAMKGSASYEAVAGRRAT
jgi:hypothetical protein